MIKKATKKQKDSFNKAANHPLQSWEWGEFRKAWGNEVLFTKYGVITLHKIPTGPLALPPGQRLGRRPLIPYKLGMFIRGPETTKKMLTDLNKIAKENNLIFIKLEPNIVINSKIKTQKSKPQLKSKKLIELLKDNKAVPGKTLFTSTSFWIDLTPPEEDLLKGFHPKTRYNIRLAERKGVKVVEDNSDKAFEKYIQLTRETVKRQGFYAHTEQYHRLMWEYLHRKPKTENREPIVRLLVAKHKKEIITTWIVFVWKDFLYYPYGASNEKYKSVMANNLMMWEAIKYGKKLGLKTFDLWGREPGKGFTRFKEGYNPQVVEFLGTWDLVTSPAYYPYKIAEVIRWKILRAKSKFVKPTF